MAFIPHTQEELKNFNITLGAAYKLEYQNKDYYNGDETIEIGKGVALSNNGEIYFNVIDPYGMDKMIMKVRILNH